MHCIYCMVLVAVRTVVLFASTSHNLAVQISLEERRTEKMRYAFSAGACWRARRVAGLRTARCAASCADLCAVSCAARSAEPSEAVCSLFKKKKKKNEIHFVLQPEVRCESTPCWRKQYRMERVCCLCISIIGIFFEPNRFNCPLPSLSSAPNPVVTRCSDTQ